jgi:class 3 adenylate cyclase/tetratricopeptide (TPR) repeat protein
MTDSRFAPYLPRLVHGWSTERSGARFRVIEGSLVSVDISGFTALAERLASKGKAGAEELVVSISSYFDRLIEVALRGGGDVLKFRGDALLLFFCGEGHVVRAAGAAWDMRSTLTDMGSAESSVGPVELLMSAAVHTGECHFFLTEMPHRELLVAGPAATRVLELEDLAMADEVVLSAEAAARVDADWLDETMGAAWVLSRVTPGLSRSALLPAVTGAHLDEYVPAPLRAHLAVSSGEAEHRQVAVAFVKLSGTDELIVSDGPRALLMRIDKLAAAVGRACETYGLTWLESDIDIGAVKLYLTAGAPASSGQDEEGMLRGIQEIIATDVGLPLRAGVNRGHVFTGDIGNVIRRTYAVMGDAVNVAARLTARAAPGDILATVDVLDRATTIYATEKEPLLVKGKERVVIAHHVGDLVGSRDPEMDATPIVGREQELDVLRSALDAAQMRRLQVVELVGEAGIGKSRIVRELRTLASGFTQLSAGAERHASSIPFFAWRNLLRRLAGIPADLSRDDAGTQLVAWVTGVMPSLAQWLPLLAIPFDAEVPTTPETEGLDPVASRDRLHATVETFLERMLVMPTLIVCEDAHWFDDSSRSLLRHLTARDAPRPWFVCVTTRSGGEPIVDSDGLGKRIELEPFDPSDSVALALSLAGDYALSTETLRVLADRSGGNPLFVRELVSAALHGQRVEDLPESVESLLTARIDTLEPTDRMLLRCASVIGPIFDLAFLGGILQGEIPAAGERARWEERVRDFVTYVGEGAFAFRHDLVRATAYEGLSFRRRAELHGRVGRALEKRAGALVDEAAGLLSHHFFEAGEHDKAWRYAVAAADWAESTFANVVAAELYERAISAVESLPDVPATEIARVQEALGDVCERFGAFDRSFAAFERARELVGSASPLADARLLGKESAVHELVGRYAEALASCVRGLDRLNAADENPERDAVRATIELIAGSINYRQTNSEEAIRWLEAAAQHAEGAGDRSTLAHAYYLLDAAHTDSGKRDGLRYLELARPIYEELGDLRGLGVVLSNLGIHAYYEGRWDESVAFYRKSRRVKERAGDVIGAVIQVNNEGEILSDQGLVDDAIPLFEEMLRVSRASGWAFGIGAALSNLGRAATRAGRFEEAHRLFRDALTVFEELSADRFTVETKARQAECLVLEGRHQEALDVATECREAAARSPVGGLEALIERSIGYALHQARRPDEAESHFEDSLGLARELNAEYELALTLRAMAATRGPPGEHLSRQSDAILERLGVAFVPAVPLP